MSAKEDINLRIQDPFSLGSLTGSLSQVSRFLRCDSAPGGMGFVFLREESQDGERY